MVEPEDNWEGIDAFPSGPRFFKLCTSLLAYEGAVKAKARSLSENPTTRSKPQTVNELSKPKPAGTKTIAGYEIPVTETAYKPPARNITPEEIELLNSWDLNGPSGIA